MADQRVYSDEEFALILHKAAELANQAESPAVSSTGLTLAEMKAAATQAGFDPRSSNAPHGCSPPPSPPPRSSA